MEKKQTICRLLGVTHQEMAMLVGVSPGHWSMFQSGKRDLPLAAMQILGQLLEKVTAEEALAKKRRQPDETTVRKSYLTDLLKENQRQLYLVGKKRAIAIGRQQAAYNKIALDQCLKTNVVQAKGAVRIIKSDDCKFLHSKKNDAGNLVRLEIKQELLEFEKSLLETKLRELC